MDSICEIMRNTAVLLLFLTDISHSMRMTQSNSHANISHLLDNLLRGYDNSIRPDFGGPPAIIEVDIMVRSMGPISEVDMTYSMDCYFRQSWVDTRLAFSGAQDTLALSISMLARIWKPDTYFYNGKQSYLHTITTPNKFVRLHQDGRVLYSSRLTIKAGCPMNLEDFPMDVQRCPLKFGSFGYTTRDVLYHWNRARKPVAIADDMKLSQFDLVDHPTGNLSDMLAYKKRLGQVSYPPDHSVLLVSFHLQRHMGNFLIQVYGPCILLVVLSWVSFWLNREATADRVSLGITTVLTMTFLGLEARTDLPKVPYPTALDFFVFLSFAFIFATILQFAVVHYFTKYGSGECYFSMEDFDSESDNNDEEDQGFRATNIMDYGDEQSILLMETIPSNDQLFEVIPLSVPSLSKIKPAASKCSWFDWPCRQQKECKIRKTVPEFLPTSQPSNLNPNIGRAPNNSAQNDNNLRKQRNRRRRPQTPRFNSVSNIDRASRVGFPLLFLVINVFYWCSYLSRSARFASITSIDGF